MDVENLKKERAANTNAVFNNEIPKRVPINLSIPQFAMAQYAGLDPKVAYWDGSILEAKADELCAMIPSDSCVLGRTVLNPSKYQALGSRSIMMGADGFMQHPNTHMMEPEEYDEFNKDPYKFIVEVAAPRTNKNLDYKNDPARAMMTVEIATQVSNAVAAKSAPTSARLAAKYGYPSAAMGGGGGYAPMDILSDQLRSFSGMSVDIRRHREKVKGAIEAIAPLCYHLCAPPDPAKYTRNAFGNYPFHMATFMREKDFAELWFPVLKRQWDGYASMGYRCGAFLEDDWTRLLDYVEELPTGSYFTFEYTDPKLLKEKLGKKFVLGSGFPIKNIAPQMSVQASIDRTKEWLDLMAPGGQYQFGLDKSILAAADCGLENLKAVAETVLTYGVYDNPGEKCGEIFNKEDYSPANLPAFSSAIYKSWEQYKAEYPNTPEEAKATVMAAENAMLRFYYGLLQ